VQSLHDGHEDISRGLVLLGSGLHYLSPGLLRHRGQQSDVFVSAVADWLRRAELVSAVQ